MKDFRSEFRALVNGTIFTQKKRGSGGERHINPNLPKKLTQSTQSIIEEKEGEIRGLRKELQEKQTQFAESNKFLSKKDEAEAEIQRLRNKIYDLDSKIA